MTVYVSRSAGVIDGVYLIPVPGSAEEAIDDHSAEVLAFTSSPGSIGAATLKQNAAGFFAAASAVARVERAAALVVRDRVNETNACLASLLAAIAGAGSLAALKTAAAAISAPPQYTIPQIKTAIANKINSTDSD